MYVEPLEISPAVAGGQTEDGNIGMDAEIEVDEAEVFIFTCFSQNCITLSRPGGGNSIRNRPKGHIHLREKNQPPKLPSPFLLGRMQELLQNW